MSSKDKPTDRVINVFITEACLEKYMRGETEMIDAGDGIKLRVSFQGKYLPSTRDRGTGAYVNG